MHDPVEPTTKRERKRRNYQNIGATGKLPWTARGIEECMRHIHKRRLELTSEEQKGWDPLVEALLFIKDKYGRCEGSPHFLRMGAIISFLTHYDYRLRADEFITTDTQGRDSLDANLVDAFARLPFTMESFAYDDVKKYIESCRKPS